MNKNYDEERTRLTLLLKQVKPDDLPVFLSEQAEHLLSAEKRFAEYMRMKFREKGILQQNVFLAADLSENYGYKLISEEKRTKQRDVILRLCLAAHFDLSETEEAMILYGMAPLHAMIPRDIVLQVAILNKIYDLYQINDLLKACGLPLILRNT